MSSFRASAFQSLSRSRTSFLRYQQRRWAQVHDVRFLATHHDPKQVLDRYKAKLDQKAQQEGHENIESLKDAYKEKIQDFRRKASTSITPEPSTPSPSATGPPPPPTPPPSPQAQAAIKATASAKSGGIKGLDSFLDVEKIRSLPPKEIETLWRLRHANNSHSICACIPVETYQRIVSAARQNPQFILPLPRDATQAEAAEGENSENAKGGADIHFLQWAFHPPASAPSPSATHASLANSHTSTIIFTHLAAYKLHGSFAQPHTTITHHLDLADDKGLVLMHGQVMPDSGVSITDASWLVSCVQRFYDFGGQASGRKGELLRMFTRGDVQNFKIEELLAEAEKV
ncbi:ATP11 family protein [Aspergillus aculeatinus CBS 121060]|uniref:ATP11-domain-containing protein n=1 Tax=Aspergillus aculeatinus CBS 121060 TaxID=1448322 RepID=A0ACD1H688_9EURO|nr:ATP11-domain-containing protein [Aspergillus aculeatinus CBS 121060]RAH69151.1 ATP11-domain-containing protein [Aspergillus aculeatinus CBS 121060]